MKRICYTVATGILFLYACKPTETELFENKIQNDEVKLIRLSADHNLLLPDAPAQMEFRCAAYGIKDVKKLVKTVAGSVVTYTEEIKQDTFLIPKDRIAPDFIKVYHEGGVLVKDNVYQTTDQQLRTITFYAQAGNLKSEPLKVTIRPLQDTESMPEIVFPVMFHLMVPPPSNKPAYSITSAQLQEKLDRLNVIFNRQRTTNPNGGNAKIVFKLAEFDRAGKRLKAKGQETINVAAGLTDVQYKQLINTTKIWDPNKYLNIYVAKFADNWTSSGALSYIAEAPKVILSSAATIPGLTTTPVAAYSETDVKDFSEAAILLNYGEFFNPALWVSNNPLELATVIGYFFGLKTNKASFNDSNVVNGDTDYCADTYMYQENTPNFSIYKTAYKSDDKFTSFNIMTDYSRKNSVTVDQVKRIRKVLESCPSRWSYKSNWAFTGN